MGMLNCAGAWRGHTDLFSAASEQAESQALFTRAVITRLTVPEATDTDGQGRERTHLRVFPEDFDTDGQTGLPGLPWESCICTMVHL
jgi:Ca2+/H+ antiporter